MLIYLVGQDKKTGENDEPTEENLENPEGDMEGITRAPAERVNILGLDLEAHWDDNVQEQRQCTFSR